MNKFWNELEQIIEKHDKAVYEGTLKKQIAVFSPRSYDDLEIIGQAIRNRTTAIVNFELLDKRTFENAFYFCLGCCYAARGSYTRIDKRIAIFTMDMIEAQNEG